MAGYFLSFDSPSTLHTSLALRQAIWRKDDPRWHICGIPEVLYTDHGSDFTSQHLEQVSVDLKIRLVFSIPGKPRGRGRIERFFATVNEMFLCELDGYAPAGGALRGKPKLTLADFVARPREFLLAAYHRRPCAETKTPPAERWEANGFLPRMPDSLEQLDLLLIQVPKARQVRADGIHFQNLRYISTTLAAYVGKWSLCGSIRGIWQKSASSMKTSSCVVPSILNLPVKLFHSERFSAREIGDGENRVASYGTVRPP